MQYKYCFDPIAANEYEKAYNWYKDRSETAADNLRIAVEESIIAICTDPFRYRNGYKNLREQSLKKYPYYIIYIIGENKGLLPLPHDITINATQKRNTKNKDSSGQCIQQATLGKRALRINAKAANGKRMDELIIENLAPIKDSSNYH